MNRAIVSLFSLLAATLFAMAAQPSNFAGEYADRNFLNGRAVFQMSLEQSGNTVSVWFSAGHNDGHGCSVDAQGNGKVTGKGALEFTFQDSSRNAGSGIVTRAGNDLSVALKVTRAADARCMEFYRQNIRLKKTK
jgi:hypothetical protein